LKKSYESPDFDMVRIIFEQTLESNIRHSYDEDKKVDGDDELLE